MQRAGQTPLSVQSDQRVEVWLAGWEQWIGGSVERVGYIGDTACALVRLLGLRSL